MSDKADKWRQDGSVSTTMSDSDLFMTDEDMRVLMEEVDGQEFTDLYGTLECLFSEEHPVQHEEVLKLTIVEAIAQPVVHSQAQTEQSDITINDSDSYTQQSDFSLDGFAPFASHFESWISLTIKNDFFH
jgi:uncharacterized protein YllA (UPF0747 family)